MSWGLSDTGEELFSALTPVCRSGLVKHLFSLVSIDLFLSFLWFNHGEIFALIGLSTDTVVPTCGADIYCLELFFF